MNARIYRINEIGREALRRFLEPAMATTLFREPEPDEKVVMTLLINVVGDPKLKGIAQVHLELPAFMLDEVVTGEVKPEYNGP